ncbi:hypothetical protein NM688_g6792 [Phlebia brevispora]|uniref:Uncharacterized protein n=1 Tax=Phlebia brevispora TaxID=194682 RepID=A0ACC1SCG1_9APHY|nr:hypothetical protein NM688_g6792 [Phlebia brevispora]
MEARITLAFASRLPPSVSISHMGRKRKQAYDQGAVIVFQDDDVGKIETTTIVNRLSADGHRVSRHEHIVYTPPSPPRVTTRTRHLPPFYASYNGGEHGCDDASLQTEPLLDEKVKWKNPYFVSTEHDSYLNEWLNEVDLFLREMIWLEGLRDRPIQCENCMGRPHEIVVRCKDCIGGPLYCRTCCLLAHDANPFHNIEHWNGRFFEKTTLQALGHAIQLGHRPGKRCKNLIPAPSDFVVFHTNGIHPVTVYYCGCDNLSTAGTRLQQLLRYELFPATVAEPTTCATFRVMELFHMLTLQGKLTGYDFYLSLEYLLDNTGLGFKQHRLKNFMRMVREWRHLKMLKRAGRAHDEGGVRGTREGMLCIRCPACPRPGFNLSENWRSEPADRQYIYNMLIAIDVNFRLKRQAVSSNERDPALGSGWGYFVEDTRYREHVLKYANQEDISTCTGFAAISQANKKFSKGYAVTGIGSIVCARHGFILPNSTGDLQKGERYCNIDYIVLSVLKTLGELPPLVLSYDIVCQWSVNLYNRITAFSDDLRIPLDKKSIRFAIPMYHFRAHKEKNHNQYSLHLMQGVGRSCCEGIERNWPKHEETAASTREMGPGSRHDTLEDHFGYANWRVYASLGSLLHKQLKEAVRERTIQAEIYAMFSERLTPENVQRWLEEVAAFEGDNSKPDPYYREPIGVTEADIRLQLAEEDDRRIASGTLTLHEVTPAAMLVELLDVEDAIRRFKHKYNDSEDRTANQNAELTDRRAGIRRRLIGVRDIQAIYMPCVPQLLARHLRDNPSAVDHPESQPLFFPHSLSPQDLALCITGIAKVEERLRDAQLHDSLDKLRVHLHIKSRMAKDKAHNVRHQGANTRARRKIEVNESKIVTLAEKYRAARLAKFALAGKGAWEDTYRVLNRADIRTITNQEIPTNMSAEEGLRYISEGRTVTSWIWMSADNKTVDNRLQAGMQDVLRARARAKRWEEQVHILIEEQRRTLVSLEQTALQWDRREQKASKMDDAYSSGLAAYAAEQAWIQRGLHAKFKALWQFAMAEDTAGALKSNGAVVESLMDGAAVDDVVADDVVAGRRCGG